MIVTETVFSMEGDVAPLEDLVRLGRKYGADVIVDEAHATGSLRAEGRGIAAELGLRARDSRDRAHLRQGAGQRGRVRLRRSALRISDQPRAHIYFQHGDAALFRGTDSRRTGAGARCGRGARASARDCGVCCARVWPLRESIAGRARLTSFR